MYVSPCMFYFFLSLPQHLQRLYQVQKHFSPILNHITLLMLHLLLPLTALPTSELCLWLGGQYIRFNQVQDRDQQKMEDPGSITFLPALLMDVPFQGQRCWCAQVDLVIMRFLGYNAAAGEDLLVLPLTIREMDVCEDKLTWLSFMKEIYHGRCLG